MTFSIYVVYLLSGSEGSGTFTENLFFCHSEEDAKKAVQIYEIWNKRVLEAIQGMDGWEKIERFIEANPPALPLPSHAYHHNYWNDRYGMEIGYEEVKEYKGE